MPEHAGFQRLPFLLRQHVGARRYIGHIPDDMNPGVCQDRSGKIPRLCQGGRRPAEALRPIGRIRMEGEAGILRALAGCVLAELLHQRFKGFPRRIAPADFIRCFPDHVERFPLLCLKRFQRLPGRCFRAVVHGPRPGKVLPLFRRGSRFEKAFSRLLQRAVRLLHLSGIRPQGSHQLFRIRQQDMLQVPVSLRNIERLVLPHDHFFLIQRNIMPVFFFLRVYEVLKVIGVHFALRQHHVRAVFPDQPKLPLVDLRFPHKGVHRVARVPQPPGRVLLRKGFVPLLHFRQQRLPGLLVLAAGKAVQQLFLLRGEIIAAQLLQLVFHDADVDQPPDRAFLQVFQILLPRGVLQGPGNVQAAFQGKARKAQGIAGLADADDDRILALGVRLKGPERKKEQAKQQETPPGRPVSVCLPSSAAVPVHHARPFVTPVFRISFRTVFHSLF